MKCDCIEKIEAACEKEWGKDNFRLSLKQGINFTTGKYFKAFPPLPASYRIKKKDGTYSQKWQSTYIAFTHCPYCGIKLKD